VPHVQIHEVIPVPSINREDNQDEEVRGERKSLSKRHLVQSPMIRPGRRKVNKTGRKR
jgi:hypothetical protein